MQPAPLSPPSSSPPQRSVVQHQTFGRQNGPVRRLISPGGLGESLKPFVFLDHFQLPSDAGAVFRMHPHSGIATLTLCLKGQLWFEDSTGNAGHLAPGDLEWMQAGQGVWHDGGRLGTAAAEGLQLWLALPPELENQAAHSAFIPSLAVPEVGPARVIAGTYEERKGPVPAPAGTQILQVALEAGRGWHFAKPPGHGVVWVYTPEDAGIRIDDSEGPLQGLVVLDGDVERLHFASDAAASFVLGSAPLHPHPLVLGHYSVHTSEQALQEGEAGIRRASPLAAAA